MILVFLENNGSNLPKSALVSIQAAISAKKLQGYEKTLGILLGAEGVDEAAQKASNYGLDEILFVKSPVLTNYLALNYVAALKAVVAELPPKLFLSAATTLGKDLTPRISQHLNAGLASDIIAFLPTQGQFQRPMYAGNILSEVEVVSEIKTATIRTTAFEPAELTASSCNIRELNISLETDERQKFLAFNTVKSERPELAEAEIIISGGRALKSAENFEKLLFPLAEKLNAAIGASRAAVDSGYAPNDWQVGQTGKVVAPKLYIAVGISGAIQHLAGMKDSKTIVAINKDPEAPIFEVADFGLVADLFDVVPELTEKLS